MNIASLIVFFLSAASLVLAEEVHKSSLQYRRSDFIELYTFTKGNCTFSVKWMQFPAPPNGFVLVNASYGGKYLHHYSVYLRSCIPDPQDSNDTLTKCVQEKKLEQHFDFQAKKINTDQFFIVKYMHKPPFSNGTWWCDVYKTEAYNFTQIDKCVYVLNRMDAMLDPHYNSVNSESQEKKMFKTATWAKCAGKNLTTICTDRFTNIKINEELWCHKINPAAGPQGYKIVLYYNNILLGSYTLSNSEKLELDKDTTKACKLFSFAKSNNGVVLTVQFMNKPNETENNWEYKCHSYRRTAYKQHGGITYDKQKGESRCNEYESHQNY